VDWNRDALRISHELKRKDSPGTGSSTWMSQDWRGTRLRKLQRVKLTPIEASAGGLAQNPRQMWRKFWLTQLQSAVKLRSGRCSSCDIEYRQMIDGWGLTALFAELGSWGWPIESNQRPVLPKEKFGSG